LLHNAKRLALEGPKVPYVVAGNVDARDEVVELLGARAVPTANVLPRIGVLDPLPARFAIRDVFVRHVIGGKGLSKGPTFGRLVRAATPDAVLAGVELLADGSGDVVVIDVGGATTDVYSVLTPDPEEAALHREVVEVLWRERTVEGDLGVRWNAPGIVEAARAERLDVPAGLAEAADARAADPSWVAHDSAGLDDDATLARLAVTVALRRHARGAEGRPAKDLRPVRLVVGSGGVLRHASAERRTRILQPAIDDLAGGWKLPEHAVVVVDGRYVLAAAGLLADDHPEAAARLLESRLSRHS
jgi:uncharacterized protein (TIGR01319 family)